MISCTRRIEFDAAHRVLGHSGKCKDLHGHRYVVEATFAAKQLDDLGMIVDFGIIKEVLGKWIDDNWDHNVVLWEKDQELGKAIAKITKQEIFYLPTNPTAENMTEYLMNVQCPKLFEGGDFVCTRIRIYETPNCFAEII
jgi:6-pyruvoyltetrahydropterin/6-carboxytetrahydropterin synthase